MWKWIPKSGEGAVTVFSSSSPRGRMSEKLVRNLGRCFHRRFNSGLTRCCRLRTGHISPQSWFWFWFLVSVFFVSCLVKWPSSVVTAWSVPLTLCQAPALNAPFPDVLSDGLSVSSRLACLRFCVYIVILEIYFRNKGLEMWNVRSSSLY